jgi:hypothetical protein
MLCSITADGAPVMIGSKKLIYCSVLMTMYHVTSLSYHCVLHLEDLCAKILPFKHVLDALMKIVNAH